MKLFRNIFILQVCLIILISSSNIKENKENVISNERIHNSSKISVAKANKTSKTIENISKIRLRVNNNNEKLSSLKVKNNKKKISGRKNKSTVNKYSKSHLSARLRLRSKRITRKNKMKNKYRRSKRNSGEGKDSSNFPQSTSFIDGDHGSIYSLTNHNIECVGSNAISGFHMAIEEHIWSNDNAYEWKCEQNNLIKGNRVLEGETLRVHVESDKDASNLLTFIPISCPFDYAIQQFRLQREGNSIYYKYKCVYVNYDTYRCKMNNSQWVNAVWGLFGFEAKSVSKLAQVKLLPERNHVLTNFALLYRSDKKQIAYNYSSCELVKPHKPYFPPVRPPVIDPNGKGVRFAKGNSKFEGLNIDCGNGYLVSASFKKNGSAHYFCENNGRSFGKIPSETILGNLTILMCPPNSALSSIKFISSVFGLSIQYSCIEMQIGFGMNEYNDSPVRGDIISLLGKTDLRVPNGEAITMVRWEPFMDMSKPLDMNMKRATTVSAPIQGKGGKRNKGQNQLDPVLYQKQPVNY